MRKLALIALAAMTIGFSCLITNTSLAADLQVTINGQLKNFSADQLLNRSDVKTVRIPLDPAYKKQMQYRAMPLSNLLMEQGVQQADVLNFVALDGFTASLPAALLFNAGKAEPWLAIEAGNDVWPPLSTKSKATAGPFYVVWTSPEAEGITQEQWPFQVTRIEKVDALENRFPMLLPGKNVPANSAIRSGFSVFQKNCLVCHTLNGGGDSTLGPDLNKPRNPTEYFQVSFLKQLIRDPKQVRTWPDSKMPGFDEKTISNQELDALIDYLKHMKGSAGTRH